MKPLEMKLHRSLALLLILLLALSGIGALAAEATPEPIARGAKGEEVQALQELLIDLGFLEDEADGSFGLKTEAALMAFQAAAGLEPSGIADAETLEALLDPDAPVPTFAPTPEPKSSAEMVWIPRTGERYHRNKKCSGMKEPKYVTIEEAIRRGYTPCKKCYKQEKNAP